MLPRLYLPLCPPVHLLRRPMVAVVLTVVGTCLTGPSGGAAEPSSTPAEAAAPIDYSRDIRPLLSDRCYQCHGPDEHERQAELRIDSKEGAFADRTAGAAIVPGDRERSLLFQRITSTDEFERMPPPDSGKELSAEEIEQIGRWIDQGAPWQEHWSFVTPARPQPPAVERSELVVNPIDNFVLARVAAAGMQPSPEADKQALIRRATLDLTGLPPTLTEIDDFLADDDPGAYERVLDRLLKSPRYGEHMTRYWLDAARYGDTHGLHLDNTRQIWPYRDWLIRAFNSNLPFDQFTIWQLAGDLLPDPTTEQLVATGFNRCNVTTSEGGSIAEEYRVRYAIDRVETTATVWMGMTAGCAVCHDHKFDPLSQAEFYRLYAYFYNFAEREMDGNALLPPGPTVEAPTGDQQARIADLETRLGQLDDQLAARRLETRDAQAVWEAALSAGAQTLPAAPADMLVYAPLDDTAGTSVANVAADAAAAETSAGTVSGSAQWTEGKHGGALAFDGSTHVEFGPAANFERTESFSYGAWVRPANEKAGAVLSRMNDGQAHRGYDLYLGSGQVYVHIIHQWDGNAIRLNTKNKLKLNEWQHVMMTYDGSSKAAGVKIYVDGQPVPVVVTHDSLNGTIQADAALRIGRRTPGAPLEGAVDDVRIYARQLSDDEVALVAGGNPVAEVVAMAPDQRNDAQRLQVQEYYLANHDSQYQKLKQERSQTETQLTAVRSEIPKTMVMGDRTDPQPVYRLVRGQYDKPDTTAALEPGVPAILPRLPEEASASRLALARWLVSPEHPLTARVTVNRFWQQLFGTGIVKTTEDFGSQGEWPSHPQLLDWLAVEFVESGWDVKRLMKLMMMSHTYRQSAVATPTHLAKDRSNRLLARGPRFRLDAEAIRDNALALSGLLVDEIGGPSVRPYQPVGLWKAVGYSGSNTVKFEQDHGRELYRRSMYIFWKRTSPPPAMQIFDAPSREYCVVRRERTNTPSAALVLLNDVQYVEAARHFAERILEEGGDSPDAKIEVAFRLATARRPSAQEISVLRKIYDRAKTRYEADPEAATALLGVGESPRTTSLDPVDHAAWTIVASTVLNLDETITK